MKPLLLTVLLAATAMAAEEGGHAELPIIYKWVNFAILAGLLVWLAVKYGGPAFKDRAERILDSLAQASRKGKEVAAKAAEVEQKLAGLAAEIEAIREEARQDMAREAEKFKQETAEHLAKLENSAQFEIEAAKKAAIKEIHAHSAQMALDLARQKVQARMTPPVQDALADGFIRSLN